MTDAEKVQVAINGLRDIQQTWRAVRLSFGITGDTQFGDYINAVIRALES